MLNLHKGIILKNKLTKSYKLLVFDIVLGKIECIPQNHKIALRLSNGTYISYAVKKWYNQYKIYDINILDVPFYWAKENLLFFHHVLELCYYFLPLDCSANDLFCLILKLYTAPNIAQAKLSKKIFLCHFFSMLGIYPSDLSTYDESIFNFIKISLNNNISNNIDITEDNLNIDKNLRRWLISCVNMHPYAHRLKTINFLKELDIHEQDN